MSTELGRIRNHSIEFIRGILVVGVCLFHFSYGTLSLTDHNWLSEFAVKNPFRYNLFFLISGFMIPYSLHLNHYDLKKFGWFLLKRWIRLAPAAYLAMLGMILLQLVSFSSKGRYINGVPFPGFNANAILGNLFINVDLFDGLWYNNTLFVLQIEFTFYIFIGIIFNFLIKEKLKAIIILIILNTVSLIVEYYSPQGFSFLSLIPYFSIGIILFEYYINRFDITETVLISAFTLLCCIYMYGWVNALAVLVTLIICASTTKIYIRPVNFLGKISYSIFLTHIFFALGLDGLYKLFFPVPEIAWQRTFWLFVIMSLVISFAYIFYRFVEEPLFRVSRRIDLSRK